MSDSFTNPYSPPKAPVKPLVDPSGDWESFDFPLATRWQRFAGSMIDAIVLLILLLPISMAVGAFTAVVYPEYFYDDSPSLALQLAEDLVVLAIMVAIFLAVNGYLLANRGQTVGKVLMKTRIVSEDHELVPLTKLFLMRYLVIWLIGLIPIVGNIFSIFDAVAIFRENRKCIHDDICGTKVIIVGRR